MPATSIDEKVAEIRASGRDVVVAHGLTGCPPDCTHVIPADAEKVRRYIAFGRERNASRGRRYGVNGRVWWGAAGDCPAILP